LLALYAFTGGVAWYVEWFMKCCAWKVIFRLSVSNDRFLQSRLQKQVRYIIDDNFIVFWFRYIYKYQNFVESGSLGLLKEIIHQDYPAFSGIMLELLFCSRIQRKRTIYKLGQILNHKG
jgi:hypothetical protein